MPAYTVTVRGGGLDHEWQVDLKTALKVIELLEGGEPAEEAVSAARAPGGEGISRWMDRARPRNNFQRLAVVAAYAEDVLGEEDGVHWDEIRKLFVKADESPPVNLGRDLEIAEDRGLIQRVGERRFKATTKGREQVGAD